MDNTVITQILIPIVITIIAGGFTFYVTTIKAGSLIDLRLKSLEKMHESTETKFEQLESDVNKAMSDKSEKLAILATNAQSLQKQVEEHTKIYREDHKETQDVLNRLSLTIANLDGTMKSLKDFIQLTKN